MKDIIKQLNTLDYMPIMQVDDSLKMYSEHNKFAKKRESATALIKRVGLPKQDLQSQNQVVENTGKLISFQEKEIRKIWNKDEWWFSVVDVISVITDSKNPSRYWSNIKNQDKQLLEVSCKFKLPSKNNKYRYTDCANTVGILRIVMSVPSPKAEPLRLWLAQVGQDSVVEKENSELKLNEIKDLYKGKGYSDEWINHRCLTIEVRFQLTEEWKLRGVSDLKELTVLKTEIAKATFGLTPLEHAEFKGLKNRDSLRDNMTISELYFAALGEKYVFEEIVKKDAQGFQENRVATLIGATLAGKALKQLEKDKGEKVISNQCYLNTPYTSPHKLSESFMSIF
jgi:DNA-damage-inducible protein D